MFIARMAIGVTGGVCIGVALVCCLIAGKQEDERMEQMLRKRGEEQKKCICFPGIGEKEVFSIRDGESLCMTASDGETYVSLCRYVDEAHAEIDGILWDLSAFARRMQEIGIAYTPFPQK